MAFFASIRVVASASSYSVMAVAPIASSSACAPGPECSPNCFLPVTH